MFSFDALDELLASSDPSPSTVVSSTSAPSVSTSGESATVSLFGVSPTNKKVCLWIPSASSGYCFGVIGQAKFCIKPVTEGKGCNILVHTTKKFSPAPHFGYLQETEARAWCAPSFDLRSLSSAQLLRLHGVQFTPAEWDDLFINLLANKIPKWLSFENSTPSESQTTLLTDLQPSTTEELLSPLAHRQSGGLLALVPSLSFDDSVDTSFADEWPAEADMQFLTASLHKCYQHFSSLKQKWKRAFTEVETSYGMVVQVIQHVHHVTTRLRHDLGSPAVLDGYPDLSAWDGISSLHGQVSSLSATLGDQSTQLLQLDNKHSTLVHSITEVEQVNEDLQTNLMQKISVMESDLQALQLRVFKLIPFLQQLKRGGTHSSSNIASQSTANTSHHSPPNATLSSSFSAPLEVLRCVQELESQVAELLSTQDASAGTNLGPSSNSALFTQVQELSAQMKQLQLRVVGRGVQIANKVFRSFDDVRAWVGAHLPTRRYGLFVDGVSIFEFFTHGHIDAETTYSSFYSQHRTGFASTYEARVASFIQNLFPTVFGKADSNVDTAEALPVLPAPERWDSNDGNTGLRYQITRNMGGAELQISESISTILHEYPEAQYIARECLHQAKRFALERCQFITLDFQKWKHRGHAKKDAWKMTAVCVRRIFEELYSERVIARDIYDQKDPDFTAAKYLWATWKAHAIMEKYLRHQFYEHPSISAMLAHHLADNYVKPDDTQGAKIKALESSIKTLQAKYDSLRVEHDKEKGAAKNFKGKATPGSG
jgi:hypothetical protein